MDLLEYCDHQKEKKMEKRRGFEKGTLKMSVFIGGRVLDVEVLQFNSGLIQRWLLPEPVCWRCPVCLYKRDVR